MVAGVVLLAFGKAPVMAPAFPVLAAVEVADCVWEADCVGDCYPAYGIGKTTRPVGEYIGYTSFSPAYAGEKSIVA